VVFLQGKTMHESDRVAAVAGGDALPEQWGGPTREVDFFDIKGAVEQLFSLRGEGHEPVFERGQLPWMHPGAHAVISVDGLEVGWCGAIHPSVLKSLDIKKGVQAFELDLDLLLKREVPIAKSVSRFPSVRRDLAVLLPEDVSYQQVKQCITASASEILEKMIVFDVYQGENLKKGYKSLAIGLIFKNVSSTLKDEEVDSVIETVVYDLDQILGAQLRG